MTPHEQAIQNMHRMAFEQAQGRKIEDSFTSLVVLDDEWQLDYRIEVFIADEEGKRLCLWVTVSNDTDIHYDCVDLFRNPELFAIWDSIAHEYDMLELDALVVGYLECLKTA